MTNLLFEVGDGQMMEFRKIQDIVDGVVGSVEFLEVYEEVDAVELGDAAVADREDLERGHLLPEHSAGHRVTPRHCCDKYLITS